VVISPARLYLCEEPLAMVLAKPADAEKVVEVSALPSV
jgi:hypothetical protein